MTIKLLTGEMIHQAGVNHRMANRTWTEILPATRAVYNAVAKDLNQDLGLCESCGERPIAPNMMLEVAGDEICSNCINPPIDESDTKVQLMHFVFNEDNTLAGAITPPAGMSLDDYKKQIQDEMSHITFVLQFYNWKWTANTLHDLYKLVNEEIPIPSPTQTHEYTIQVLKDFAPTGLGTYKCATYDRFENTNETGAAIGLIDAIEEYAWSQLQGGTN